MKSRTVSCSAILVIVVLAICICAVAAFKFREKIGRDRFIAKVEDLRAAGQPVDNADLETIYADKTDDADTSKWLSLLNEVKHVSRAASKDGVYSFDPKSNYVSFVGSGAWPYDDANRQFLKPFQPLLDQTRELAKARKAVTFPKKINSYMTNMSDIDNIRIIGEVISLDGLMSIRDRQGDRLVEDVFTLFNLAEVIENEPFTVGSLVSMACDGVATKLVKEAVVADVLSQSQLERLQARLLEELDHVPAWRKMIREERAAMIPAFFDPSVLDDGSMRIPKGTKIRGWDGDKYLELMAKAEEASGEDLSEMLAIGKQIRTETDELNRSLIGMYDTAFTALMLPAMDMMGQSLVRREHDIRLATYATTCRLYMLQHGKSPESLTILNLPHEKLVLAGGKAPGYRVTADGDSLLWFFDLENSESTPAEPPPPKYPESLAPELFTWTIPLKVAVESEKK